MSRVRYQCRDCARKGRGGYFSIPRGSEGQVKCPYCGSSNVKKLG